MIQKKHVEEYLSTRRATLWGRAFDIYSESGRQAAVEFLYEAVHEIDEIYVADIEREMGLG